MSNSPRDYARQAEQRRESLIQNLDELESRLTPGNIIDEVLKYARGPSGTFFRSASNAARENPVPSMLISTGLMMLLSNKMGSRRQESGNFVSERGGEGAHNMGSRMAGTAQETARGIKESAGEAVNRLTDRAAEATHRFSEGADQAYAQMSESTERVYTNLARRAQDLRNQTAALVNDQPLVFGALGLAVGAAVAALLPATKAENEMMGDASDRVKEAAADLASGQVQAAKEAAADLAERVKDLGQENADLTGEAARETVRKAADKLKDVTGPGRGPH